MARETRDPEFLTTREVAALLRVRERKVYELARSGEIPCRRVTGKLLFPRAGVETWLAGGQTAALRPRAPDVVAGSHDPLLDWALRESGSGLASLFDGSLDGLERLAAGARRRPPCLRARNRGLEPRPSRGAARRRARRAGRMGPALARADPRARP